MRLTDLGHPVLLPAAITPLTVNGTSVDIGAIEGYAAFLEAGGADGAFVCGTTGEGVLLSIAERQATTKAFRAALHGALVVHAGAQTTRDTIALARHALDVGADAVAVIAPPYFPLDEDGIVEHFVAAARACAPLPFYCYAFAARSGYPLPVAAVRRIAAAIDNLAGLKVSESPFERVAPYLELGLPVLIGNEPLIPAGMAGGAIGSVSGMGAALPEEVRRAVDDPSPVAGERLATLRTALEASGQFIAAAKAVLQMRGVEISPTVRAPLRTLRPEELEALEVAVAPFIPTAVAAER